MTSARLKLAEALGRTVDGVNWKIDSMASNLAQFRTPNEKPPGLSSRQARLLRDYEGDSVRVAERCRLSYKRLVAGESPRHLVRPSATRGAGRANMPSLLHGVRCRRIVRVSVPTGQRATLRAPQPGRADPSAPSGVRVCPLNQVYDRFNLLLQIERPVGYALLNCETSDRCLARLLDADACITERILPLRLCGEDRLC